MRQGWRQQAAAAPEKEGQSACAGGAARYLSPFNLLLPARQVLDQHGDSVRHVDCAFPLERIGDLLLRM